MSWAELLRRSAKYARKSLTELAASLKPPIGPEPIPSYERAFARYPRNGPFLPPVSNPHDSQRRWFSSSCGVMRRHAPFFRGNVKHCMFSHEAMLRQILHQNEPWLAEFYAQHHRHWKAHHRYWHRRSHGHHHGFRQFKKLLHNKFRRLLYLHFRQFKRFARCVAAQSHYNAPAIVPVATYFHHYLPTMWHASSQNYLNYHRPWSQLSLPSRSPLPHCSSPYLPLAHRFSEVNKFVSAPSCTTHAVAVPNSTESASFGFHLDLFVPTTLPSNSSLTDPVSLYHAKIMHAQRYIYPLSFSERALLHELLVRIQRFRAQRECPISKLIQRIQLRIPQLVDLCTGIRESISGSLLFAERAHIQTVSSIRPVELLERANYAMLMKEPEHLPMDRVIRNELSSLPSYRAVAASADTPARSAEVVGFPDLTANSVDPFSAAVDFSIVPRLTLPSVSELTETTLDSVRQSINSYIGRLQTVVADISRLAEYGELPLSIEMNNTTLRVHFPNSDTDRVNVLLADKEVRGGEVVEIVNPSVANDHDFNEIETISDFSSGVTSIFSSESSVQDMWTQVTAGPPDLTVNDSSLSDEHESSLLTLE